MKRKILFAALFFSLIPGFFLFCYLKAYLTMFCYFHNTPGYAFAKAVYYQDLKQIRKLAEKNNQLLNITDTKYGYPVIVYAMLLDKYESVKILLELGASPDIQEINNGLTPLYFSASPKVDIKYMKLLLEYGANPDIGSSRPSLKKGIPIHSQISGELPLMELCTRYVPDQKRQFEKIKYLVEEGHVDYEKKDSIGRNSAIVALANRNILAAHYLIVELKSCVSDCFYFPEYIEEEQITKRYVDEYLYDLQCYLKDFDYGPGSEQYVKVDEIINESIGQGIKIKALNEQ